MQGVVGKVSTSNPRKSTHFASSSARVSLLYNKSRSKKHIYYQNSPHEKCIIKSPVMESKPSYATTKVTLFIVSKDEWNTKEDTGKSMKNASYMLRYTKMNLSG